MNSLCFRMRSYGAGANHEIVLPNGKVILIDPYFTRFDDADALREGVTGADYIILTHGHYDHDSDIGYFVKKFNALVFCGVMTAEALMKYHEIPYQNLFSVFPNSKFTMDDFTLEFWQAKHNIDGGMLFDSAINTGDPEHRRLDMLGSMESLDWMITTNNGFRMMMCSGRALFHDVFERCRAVRPNVLFRQAGFRHIDRPDEQVSARELAELLAKYGAQIIFPFHMDVIARKIGKDATAAYMDKVGQELETLDPGALFINPRERHWYRVGIGVSED